MQKWLKEIISINYIDMDTLKDIIKENKEMFTEQSLPEGDLDRFLAKLDKSGVAEPARRPRMKLYRALSLPVAAALILFMGVGIFAKVTSEENQLKRVYVEYCNEVATLSSEIQMMTVGDDMRMADRAVENITFEAIPLEEQLPTELPKREKVQIMKDYYSQKLEGVRRLKTLMSDSNTGE